jgi:hypothetical protein
MTTATAALALWTWIFMKMERRWVLAVAGRIPNEADNSFVLSPSQTRCKRTDSREVSPRVSMTSLKTEFAGPFGEVDDSTEMSGVPISSSKSKPEVLSEQSQFWYC